MTKCQCTWVKPNPSFFVPKKRLCNAGKLKKSSNEIGIAPKMSNTDLGVTLDQNLSEDIVTSNLVSVFQLT